MERFAIDKRISESEINRIIDIYNNTGGNISQTVRETGYSRATVQKYTGLISASIETKRNAEKTKQSIFDLIENKHNHITAEMLNKIAEAVQNGEYDELNLIEKTKIYGIMTDKSLKTVELQIKADAEKTAEEVNSNMKALADIISTDTKERTLGSIEDV